MIASDTSSKSEESDEEEELPEAIPLSDDLHMFPHKKLTKFGNVFEGSMKCEISGAYSCAIKFPRELEQNTREVKILQILGPHTHVITLLGSGTFKDPIIDQNYIVLEKCHEMNLHQYLLKRKEVMPLYDVDWGMNICKQIINGMKYIHERLIIHKDLKPSNILLTHDLSTIKIADFGSSQELKCTSSMTFCPNMFGTIGYRPPESFGQSFISLKSDIFALGALLYFTLSNGGSPLGNDPYLWEHNTVNGVIDVTQMLLPSPGSMENLMKSMLQMDRCCRPSIWKIESHSCWTSDDSKWEFNNVCEEEIDDCDVIASKSNIEDSYNSEEEKENERKVIRYLDKFLIRETKRETVIVLFDRLHERLQQLNINDKTLSPRQEWRNDMKKGFFTAVSLSNYIYVLTQNQLVYRLKYGDDTSEWERMADMIDRDDDVLPHAVAYSGVIYAVGGSYGTSNRYHSFQNVSKFTPSLNNWEKLQQRRWNSRDAAIAVSNNHLFIIGGEIYNYNVIKNVEAFNLVDETWDEAAPIQEARYSAATAQYQRKIYLFGGRGSDKRELNSVEVYNSAANQWTFTKSMTEPRSGIWFRCHVIEGNIYAVGGGQPSTTMEVYDVAEDQWKEIEIKEGINIYSSVIVTLKT